MIQAHSQIANPSLGEIKPVSQGGESLVESFGQGGFGDMLLSLLQNLNPAADSGKINSVEPGSVFPDGGFFPSDGKKTTSADAELGGDAIGFDHSALGEFLQNLGINLHEMTQEQWKSGIQNLAGNTPGEVVLGGGSGLNNLHSGKDIGKNIQMLLEGLEKQGLKINSLPKLSYEELQKLEAVLEKIKSNIVGRAQVENENGAIKITEVNFSETQRASGEISDLQREEGEIRQKDLAGHVRQGDDAGSNQQVNLNDMFEGTEDDNINSGPSKANARKMMPEDFKNFAEVSLESESSKSKKNQNSGAFFSKENNSKEQLGNPVAGGKLAEREHKAVSSSQKIEKIFQQLQQLNGKISITNNSNGQADSKPGSQSQNSGADPATSQSFLVKTDSGWEIKGQSEFSLRSKGRFESNENNSFETPRLNVSSVGSAKTQQAEGTHGSKHIWGQEKEIIRQISQGIVSVEKEGVKEIKINLHPASLGKIKIVMEMLGDKVNGRIEVENDDVRRVVENNLHKLKESASQHQVRLDSIEVSVDPDKSHNAARQEREGKWGQNFNQGNGREHRKKGGFEGGSDNEHGQKGTRRRWGYNTLELVA